MSIEINEKNMLGFGCMRLPLKAEGTGAPKPEDIDIPLVAEMDDVFLERGFTYFDTSFVYHNGHSEAAVREALVEKHPRDAFQLATKFPTMLVKTEDQVDGFFEQQLQNLGVDYFNFYLLHILMTQYLEDGKGNPGVVETCHLFEHLKKWKAEGKARHIGFSFHDSADVLDKLLTDHPEVEFVQIVLNYYDWDSAWIQSRENLEVIQRHGIRAIAMEPVKGGYLANVPEECLKLMRAMNPDLTPAAWAVRFAASQPGVFKVLSGMSTLAQVEDNTAAMADFKPLTPAEQDMLFECAKIMRQQGPLHQDDYSVYEGLTFRGLPVGPILQTYNSLVMQPDPSFAADNNYLRQELLKKGVTDLHQQWPPEQVMFDGKDISDTLATAWDYLVKMAF